MLELGVELLHGEGLGAFAGLAVGKDVDEALDARGIDFADGAWASSPLPPSLAFAVSATTLVTVACVAMPCGCGFGFGFDGFCLGDLFGEVLGLFDKLLCGRRILIFAVGLWCGWACSFRRSRV